MSLISYVTRIHFADHVLEHALDVELDSVGAKRPLVVTDRDGTRPEALERLKLAFPRRIAAQYVSLPEEGATEAVCEALAASYRNQGCDALIAFGAAAAIDAAKATGIATSHEEPLASYAGSEAGTPRIRSTLPPLIAIPTVAGTGTEVAGVALIATAAGSSMFLISRYLVPRVVICDPTLTLDLPPARTASTGMDALTHCLETFISCTFNPPADGMALDGLRRAFANLEKAVCLGSDLEARREIMAAGLNGALAQQKGLGGVHAMSNSLGGLGLGRDDHGAINAILLPLVLEFNAPAAGNRYSDIRRELALAPRADLGEAIAGLRHRLQLPGRLSEIGADEATLERAAHLAVQDYANRTNPRKADAADYLSLLRAAL